MHSDILGGNSFFFFRWQFLFLEFYIASLWLRICPHPEPPTCPAPELFLGSAEDSQLFTVVLGCLNALVVQECVPFFLLRLCTAHISVWALQGLGHQWTLSFPIKVAFDLFQVYTFCLDPPAVSQTCTSCHPWWVSTAHGDTDVLYTLASPACCPSQNKAPGESPRSSLLADRPQIWESSKILYSLSGIELGHIRQAFYHWAIALELCQVLYVQVTKTRYSAQLSPQSYCCFFTWTPS